jgi:predicted nicotinamide N-methyase
LKLIADDVKFIREHTVLANSVLVPDISLYLATEITPLWQASEVFLAQK